MIIFGNWFLTTTTPFQDRHVPAVGATKQNPPSMAIHRGRLWVQPGWVQTPSRTLVTETRSLKLVVIYQFVNIAILYSEDDFSRRKRVVYGRVERVQ